MDIQLTDEQLSGILAEGKAQMIEAAVDSVRSHVTYAIKNQLTESIRPIVQTFIDTEIVPELADALMGAKSTILTKVVDRANEIGGLFASALANEVAERMGTDYKRRKFFETLFG